MKCKWNELEGVLFHSGIIFFEVVVQCFFVADMPMILKMVMNFVLVWISQLLQGGSLYFDLILILAELLPLLFAQKSIQTTICVLPDMLILVNSFLRILWQQKLN